MAAGAGHILAAEASKSAMCPLLSVFHLSTLLGACTVGGMPSRFDRSIVALSLVVNEPVVVVIRFAD